MLILAVFGALLLAFLVYVALQSPEFKISRSATISAPPARVFAHVNDFHRWEDWSPWAKLDPDAKADFAGPSEGAGAQFSWAGNNKVGEGTMTIVESRPNEVIRIRLEFLKPFPATNQAEFTFSPEGEGTRVTWTMTGTNNFIARIFCTVMRMDRMVGRDFEKGLASMKAIVEAPAS